MNDIVTWASDSIGSVLMSAETWVLGTHDNPGHGITILFILIIGMLLYLIGGKIVERSVRRAVRSARHREWHKKDIEKRQKTLGSVAKSIWHIAVTLGIIYAILRDFIPDINTLLAPLFASAGIIGVAIGFGAQSLIKDFISGLFIISENQYRVGDIVDIEGAAGTVERIGARSTVIRDVNGNVHYMPNGMITHVINKTMGYSMARFVVALNPASDIDKVVEIINTLGTDLAGEDKWKTKIIEPPEFVSLGELTGTSVEVIIAGKTQPSDQWAVIAEMRRRLLQTLESNGIELAVVPHINLPPAK